MNYTEIKRLFQNNTEFVPITLAEAVVVNTSSIPGLTNLGITTLDKVLRSTLGLVGTNAQNIETLGGNILTLTGVVQEINTELQNKQDKLTAGVGISITKAEDKTIISVNHTLEIYKIITTETWNQIKDAPGQEYENVIYLVPQPQITSVDKNIFKEFLCVLKDGAYVWEEFGTIQTEVDLSGYVTNETFNQLVTRVQSIEVQGIFADNVYTSNGQQVVVQYSIPSNLYDSAVNTIDTDEIVEPSNDES
jgi:hypothetical protein